MRKSVESCRIDAVAVTRVVIEGEGPPAVQAALLGRVDGTLVTFGTTVAKSGWPKEVTELVTQLRGAIEDHLAHRLFEEKDDGDSTADRGDAVPAGIVEFGLGGLIDDPEQL